MCVSVMVPPGSSPMTAVLRPKRPAYMPAARPAQPAPTMSTSEGLEEEEVLTKLGREPGDARYPGYIGGWVWKTQEAAQSYLDANQDGLGFIGHVYGLLLPTSWDVDVTPEPGEDGIHNLLPDAVIFYPYERN